MRERRRSSRRPLTLDVAGCVWRAICCAFASCSRDAARFLSELVIYEEYIYDKLGRLENPGFLDYRCPVASDMPMIDAVMVEVPNPRHPFGVRGVGEVPIAPPMAAVANAIHAAIGARLRDLPMSPPKILAELDAEEPRRLAAE